MCSSQNPFYFEICLARKNRSPDLDPNGFGEALDVSAKKVGPGSSRNNKSRHFGKPKCLLVKTDRESRESHGEFFSIKKV